MKRISSNFRNHKTQRMKYAPSLIDRLRAQAWARGSKEPIKCKACQNTPLGRKTNRLRCSGCRAAEQYLQDVVKWMQSRGLIESSL